MQVTFLLCDMVCLGYQYSDVIMSAMVSQITDISIVFLTVCSGADKKNIKAPRQWPLWRETTGDQWLPLTKGKWRGKGFHLMTSSWHMHWNRNVVILTIFSPLNNFSCSQGRKFRQNGNISVAVLYTLTSVSQTRRISRYSIKVPLDICMSNNHYPKLLLPSWPHLTPKPVQFLGI